MSESKSLPKLSASKMITCIMPRGEAQAIMEVLYQDYGLQAIESYTGRGQDSRMSLKDWREMDILNVIVSPAEADTIFQLIYHLANIGQHSGRLLFQSDMPLSTAFVIPELEAQAD